MTVSTSGEYDVFDPEVIKEITKVEQYLTETYKTGPIISPATILRTINQSLNGGSPEQYIIPESASGFKRLQRYLKRFLRSSRTAADLVTDDLKLAGSAAGLKMKAVRLHLKKPRRYGISLSRIPIPAL